MALLAQTDDETNTSDGKGLFSAPMTNERRRAESWLGSRIDKGARSGLFGEMKAITPALAELMLARNLGNNRAVRRSKVERFVRTLKDGRWQTTHQGLLFDKTGALIDGQHRLSAIIDSGISAVMWVFFGAEPNAFALIDSGTPRTQHDILRIDGHINTVLLAAAANLLRRIEQGSPRSGTHVLDNDEVTEFVAKRPTLTHACAVALTLASKVRGPTAAFAVAAHLTLEYDEKKAEEFWEKMISGVGVSSATDPVHILRERLVKRAYTASHNSRAQCAGDLVLAFNMFLKGRRQKSICWRDGQPFPKVGD